MAYLFSYDVATENLEVVAEVRNRVERLLAGFLEPVQRAYAESHSRKVNPEMPTGSRPRTVP